MVKYSERVQLLTKTLENKQPPELLLLMGMMVLVRIVLEFFTFSFKRIENREDRDFHQTLCHILHIFID